MKYFIRFTDDIYRDLDRGYSSDSFNEDNFEGLCAYLLKVDERYEDVKQKGIERAKELSEWNGKHIADHYDGNFVILKGTDVGAGHDGKIVKNAKVVYKGNIK